MFQSDDLANYTTTVKRVKSHLSDRRYGTSCDSVSVWIEVL